MDHFFHSKFMPHGHCYFWTPDILWTQAISNSIIALAYCSIPISLILIFRKRNDIKYIWMMVLFAVFIFGCGITHIMDVIVIWNPLYRIDSFFRVITAVASIGTALVLIRETPNIIEIPTAEQWKKAKRELKRQMLQLEEKDKTIEAFKELQFLSEVVPQIVWTTKEDGLIDYFNQKWYVFTGTTFDQFEEFSWLPFVHDEDYDETIKTWNYSLKTGNAFEHELRLKNKDDNYCWHLARALPMKDDKGEIVKWFGTFTDIHHQKLYSNELDQKNKELQKINNDLDNFVYAASHDLKAPVSNLEGIISALNREVSGKYGEKEQKLFNMMELTLFRFKKTILDLTEISKIHKDPYGDVQQVYFSSVLEEVKTDLDKLIVENKAVINANFEVDVMSFSQNNLRSIVYNLLSNSLKYHSPERTPMITLSTHETPQHVVFTAQDNGLGIKEEHLPRIFGMFKRFHSHVEGSGVGLYIIKRIVENNKGEIQVESEVGKGTIFRIFLPKTEQ